mmetsp:Transcript_124403/g.398382  ORF Transcript_124403/g.398382 Transcript_124403/m.398382 type:complete len:314 (-) Transcript_124403:2098-3039(-)
MATNSCMGEHCAKGSHLTGRQDSVPITSARTAGSWPVAPRKCAAAGRPRRCRPPWQRSAVAAAASEASAVTWRRPEARKRRARWPWTSRRRTATLPSGLVASSAGARTGPLPVPLPKTKSGHLPGCSYLSPCPSRTRVARPVAAHASGPPPPRHSQPRPVQRPLPRQPPRRQPARPPTRRRRCSRAQRPRSTPLPAGKLLSRQSCRRQLWRRCRRRRRQRRQSGRSVRPLGVPSRRQRPGAAPPSHSNSHRLPEVNSDWRRCRWRRGRQQLAAAALPAAPTAPSSPAPPPAAAPAPAAPPRGGAGRPPSAARS